MTSALDVCLGVLHSSDDALSTSLRQTLCTRVPLRSTRRHRAPLAGELSAVLISCSLAARPPCSETLAMSYCSAQVVLFSKPRWFCFASLLTFHWVTGRTDILSSKGWYPCVIITLHIWYKFKILMHSWERQNKGTLIDSTLCSWPQEYVELVLKVVIEREHSAWWVLALVIIYIQETGEFRA